MFQLGNALVCEPTEVPGLYETLGELLTSPLAMFAQLPDLLSRKAHGHYQKKRTYEAQALSIFFSSSLFSALQGAADKTPQTLYVYVPPRTGGLL